MEPEFWLDKWAGDQIGFHEATVHPLLRRHWPALGLAPGSSVFVPLCGKSLDLVWLHAVGHAVVGIELAARALADFAAEQHIALTRVTSGPFVVHRGPGYTLYCGDVFALDAHALGSCTAIYDRAALIALPETMRRAYAAHLSSLAGPGTRMLLITVDYATTAVGPPPFVVGTAELTELYGDAWSIEPLDNAVAEVKGHPASETVYKLIRR